MLEKISKALDVIEKLKELPKLELRWVFMESKRTIANNRLLLNQQLKTAGPDQKELTRVRLHTLDVVDELLDAVDFQ